MTCTSTARRPQLAFSPTRSRVPSRAAATTRWARLPLMLRNRSARSPSWWPPPTVQTRLPRALPPLSGWSVRRRRRSRWKLERVNGQCRRHRLRRVPQRHEDRDHRVERDVVHLHRAHLQHHLHRRARRLRRRRQPLRPCPGHLGHVDFCLLRKARWRECLPQPLGERFSGATAAARARRSSVGRRP